MAKIKAEQALVPSVLDRLLDDDPGVNREPAKNRNQILRELKQSVRRDLENLLNTRTRCGTWPSHLKELKRSLVNYGIPDFTEAGLGDVQDRDAICLVLQTAIRQGEPRFKSVKVQILGNAEPLDRTLRFRIDALLIADPAPEPIVFDSTLKPATGDFEVNGVDA
jgi:type VI secretion system protein ImpF